MTKYVDIKVSIAPINSSENPRIIYFEKCVPMKELPENSKEIIRWVDKFENLGLDFDTGEYDGKQEDLPLNYDLGYSAFIEYDRDMNTGVVKYSEIGGWRSPILLRRENYIKTIEYIEVYPSLEYLKNTPLNEVVDYIKYLYNKEDALVNVTD